jgi:hypothetical protein
VGEKPPDVKLVSVQFVTKDLVVVHDKIVKQSQHLFAELQVVLSDHKFSNKLETVEVSDEQSFALEVVGLEEVGERCE